MGLKEALLDPGVRQALLIVSPNPSYHTRHGGSPSDPEDHLIPNSGPSFASLRAESALRQARSGRAAALVCRAVTPALTPLDPLWVFSLV